MMGKILGTSLLGLLINLIATAAQCVVTLSTTVAYRTYTNVDKLSYTLKKRLASIFQVIATADFIEFLFFYLMTHYA